MILEDEPFIAMDLQFAFQDAGARAAVAANCSDAFALLKDETIDAAVLDVNLGRGATCEPVAVALRRAGIPFVLHTGDLDRQGEHLRSLDAPVLPKPTMAREVAERVLRLIGA
jgi:DNA-binding response OmpR family regulator